MTKIRAKIPWNAWDNKEYDDESPQTQENEAKQSHYTIQKSVNCR